MACLFALGRPWKKPLYYNKRFTVWAIGVTIICTLLLFINSTSAIFWSDEVPISANWRGLMFFLVIVNASASCLWELMVFPRLVVVWKKQNKQGRGELGTVFGRNKLISGNYAKEYHKLRGNFEALWNKID